MVDEVILTSDADRDALLAQLFDMDEGEIEATEDFVAALLEALTIYRLMELERGH